MYIRFSKHSLKTFFQKQCLHIKYLNPDKSTFVNPLTLIDAFRRTLIIHLLKLYYSLILYHMTYNHTSKENTNPQENSQIKEKNLVN